MSFFRRCCFARFLFLQVRRRFEFLAKQRDSEHCPKEAEVEGFLILELSAKEMENPNFVKKCKVQVNEKILCSYALFNKEPGNEVVMGYTYRTLSLCL